MSHPIRRKSGARSSRRRIRSVRRRLRGRRALRRCRGRRSAAPACRRARRPAASPCAAAAPAFIWRAKPRGATSSRAHRGRAWVTAAIGAGAVDHDDLGVGPRPPASPQRARDRPLLVEHRDNHGELFHVLTFSTVFTGRGVHGRSRQRFNEDVSSAANAASVDSPARAIHRRRENRRCARCGLRS